MAAQPDPAAGVAAGPPPPDSAPPGDNDGDDEWEPDFLDGCEGSLADLGPLDSLAPPRPLPQ